MSDEDEHEDPQLAAAPAPGWTRLLRPFRSEDAAFRVVLWTAGIFIAFAAVVLLVRAVL